MKDPHPLDLTLLTIFVEVANAGSFTLAAQSLELSQSSVSASIQRLERAVGRRLMNRTARSVRLTEDGERMMAIAKTMLTMADDALRQFGEPRFTQVVRLGLPNGIRSAGSTDLLARFRRTHPTVQVNFRNDYGSALRQLVETEALDLAIIATNDAQAERRIWSDTLVWAGDPDLVASGRGDVPVVLHTSPSVLRSELTRSLQAGGRSYVAQFESDSLHDVVTAAKAGIGMCVLPRAMVPIDLPIVASERVLPSLGQLHYVLRLSPGAPEAAHVLGDMFFEASPGIFSIGDKSVDQIE